MKPFIKRLLLFPVLFVINCIVQIHWLFVGTNNAMTSELAQTGYKLLRK